MRAKAMASIPCSLAKGRIEMVRVCYVIAAVINIKQCPRPASVLMTWQSGRSTCCPRHRPCEAFVSVEHAEVKWQPAYPIVASSCLTPLSHRSILAGGLELQLRALIAFGVSAVLIRLVRGLCRRHVAIRCSYLGGVNSTSWNVSALFHGQGHPAHGTTDGIATLRYPGKPRLPPPHSLHSFPYASHLPSSQRGGKEVGRHT